MTKNISILCLFVIAIAGCKKTGTVSNTGTDNKTEMVKQLGFDVSKISFNNTGVATTLNFNNVDEAKMYFNRMADDAKTSFTGSVKLKKVYVPSFNPLAYLRSHAQRGTSGTCQFPWFQNCGEDELDDEDYGNPTGAPSLNHWVGWSGYNVTFTYTTAPDGHIVVTNFSSSLIGFHPGVSWENGNGSAINYPNSALIYFTVNGYQNYNLIINGLGTLFTQAVTITGIYNTNTGEYTITIN